MKKPISMERGFNSFKREVMDNQQEDSLEKRAKFRVAFFGTGSEDDKHDLMAVFLAGQLAQEVVGRGQHKVVTGGYRGGIMGEASRAAYQQAQAAGRCDLLPEGITLGPKLAEAAPEAVITEKETLPERLKDLIDSANAVVVLHGGIGTVLELIAAWQSYAVRRAKGREDKKFIPKPIIIADSSLEHLDLLAFLKRRGARKFALASDHVYLVSLSSIGPKPEIKEIVNDINRIIEIYYQKSLGVEFSKEDREWIDKFSLKRFFAEMGYFKDGAGI